MRHDDMARHLRLSRRGLSYLYSGERAPGLVTLGLILHLPIPGIDELALRYLRCAALEER